MKPLQSGLRVLPRTALLIVAAVLALALLSACGSDDETTTASQTPSNPVSAPSVSMSFPTSLTGTPAAATSAGPSCDYPGARENDPLRNGYTMTKWLVGNVAGWLCITDFLSDLANQLGAAGLPVDGTFVDIPPDPADPGGPTGIAVTTGTTSTLELYFQGDTANPSVYLAWAGSGSDVQGRLVVLPYLMEPPPPGNLNADPEAPTHMRLDFTQSATQRSASMVMAFDPYDAFAANSWNNPWATGFRIDAVRTEADGSFDITGYIATHGQFDPGYRAVGTETPALVLKAVSDSTGKGASVATMADVGQGFIFTPNTTDGLGYFLYSKDDKFYFLADATAEWISKSVTTATFKGGLTNTTYSDANIDSFLGLSGTTASCKGGTDADCVTLLNAIFDAGASTFGTDLNDTSPEPSDGRQAELAALTALTQATPDSNAKGDWTGVFDLTFTPAP